jgi:hypothetical protein
MENAIEFPHNYEKEAYLDNCSFIAAHAYTEARVMNMLGWSNRTPKEVGSYIDRIADGFGLGKEDEAIAERTRGLKEVIQNAGDAWERYQPVARGEQFKYFSHVEDRAAKQLLTDLAVARAPLPLGYSDNNISPVESDKWRNNIGREAKKLLEELGFNEETWKQNAGTVNSQRVMRGILTGKVQLSPTQPRR